MFELMHRQHLTYIWDIGNVILVGLGGAIPLVKLGKDFGGSAPFECYVIMNFS